MNENSAETVEPTVQPAADYYLVAVEQYTELALPEGYSSAVDLRIIARGADTDPFEPGQYLLTRNLSEPEQTRQLFRLIIGLGAGFDSSLRLVHKSIVVGAADQPTQLAPTATASS